MFGSCSRCPWGGGDMKLFDDFERENADPAAYGEDSFSFLNRAARPF